jgi:hypothetical protein
MKGIAASSSNVLAQLEESRYKWEIGDALPTRHAATILRSLAIPVKPDPPKVGDGKTRVLTDSENRDNQATNFWLAE